ncbi:hypothetical protein F5Y12DRAFT_719593 [Xylaria sp. FL1777]|nr:hypothetical protein F5Y12DRAFT_719593 [Xylaria sp. FL1777]
MSFIAIPTQTADTYHQTINEKLEQPVITLVAKAPETSPFFLGPDTCGFTVGSAITCDVGYECANVDSYRGCCVAGAADCSATIYTDCVNNEEMPNAAMCGPQTLCCPESKAYCATYGFTTEEQPGATFTHVRCAESPGFGELYPYPPELSTTTESSSTESTSSTLISQPADSTNSSSSSSISSGAIAGAVVGSVVFAALAILGTFLFINRRRRQRGGRVRDGSEAMNTTPPSAENVHSDEKALDGPLRSLSTIHEQRSSLPSSASSGNNEGPESSALRLQSFGENWPLGPRGPISPRKPLSSHPVAALERRLSQNELAPRPQSTRYMKGGVRTPTPPLPGTRLSPPPPLRKPELVQTPRRAASTGLALQSPRLSYIPPPTIDTAFGEEVERSLDGICEPGRNDVDKGETISGELPFLAIGAPWPTSLNTTTGMNDRRLTSNGVYLHANTGISDLENDHESMSTLDEDDCASGDQRIRFLPALSIRSNVTERGDPNDIVSPVSLDDEGGAQGRISPMTVSPPESQRGSFGL